jgi:hypothetical protein
MSAIFGEFLTFGQKGRTDIQVRVADVAAIDIGTLNKRSPQIVPASDLSCPS